MGNNPRILRWCDGAGEGSLLVPSMEGNLDEVKRLVGAFIADCHGLNYKGGRGSALRLAAFVNSIDASSTGGGNAAVHGAVFSGHLDVLSFLVECCEFCDGGGGERGASSSSSSTAAVGLLTLRNGLGCSPLWLAAGYDRIPCLEYLMRKLRDLDLLESSLLRDVNSTGDSPFLAAASRGNVAACRCILKSVEGCLETFAGVPHRARRFRRMKARIVRTANRVGDTPLQVAVASGHTDLVSFLLEVDDTLCRDDTEEGRDINGDDSDNDDDYSKKCIDRKNASGLSPLIVACERNHPSIARLLLEHGANQQVKDARGRSPLAVAAFCGCVDVVEYLLDYYRNSSSSSSSSTTTKTTSLALNATDHADRTPLWLAARTGNLTMTKLLVDAGADTTIEDRESLTPLDVAVKFKKEKVVEYLKSCTSSSATEASMLNLT
jgi:ankyrin repeat protein